MVWQNAPQASGGCFSAETRITHPMKIALKVTPGARREEILGWEDDYPGVGRVLKLKVTAPPVEGKANKAIETFLARTLGLSKGYVRIVQGSTGHIKRVELPDGTDLAPLNR